MEVGEKNSFLGHFAGLEDPRSRQLRHELMELLLVAVFAVLSGADNWVDVAEWGQSKRSWLQRFLPFKNGTASHHAFGRVFALLVAEGFEQRFMAWMASVCRVFEGQQVAIDGKTVRRSKTSDRKAIHLVSAFAHGLGVMLGQVKTAEKSNEITAIPELLEALLLKGCIVTIDAIGCQKDIAAKIVEQGADYVLIVKNNQPRLAAAVEGFFETAERESWVGVAHTRAEWIEKDHGRIETRRCWVTDDLRCLEKPSDWAAVEMLVMVESLRDINGVTSKERRYYLSSLRTDATHMGTVVRGHWSIENSLHWSLDVAYGEDQSRMREGHSAENFSILRRITLNLIRQDKTVKAGVKARRLKAGWDDNYRQKLLGMQPLA